MGDEEKDYCTCDEEYHDAHTCPLEEDLRGDYETLCKCCPYCTKQCALNI